MEKTSATNGRDALAFEVIYRENYQQLFSFGYQLCGDKEMTKDALQEVFLIMWEQRQRVAEIDHLPAYLRKVAHRQVIKRLKEASKLNGNNDGSELEISIAPYEELVINLEMEAAQRSRLKQALENLSATEKEMLRLKYFQSMSYDQIAEQSGKSKQTIYNQVFKAIGKLKKLMNPLVVLILL